MKLGTFTSSNDNVQQYNDIPKRFLGGGPIVNPGPNDVLSGRGRHTDFHIGNITFRSLAARFRESYLSTKTKKLEKVHVANRLVMEVRSMTPPGRFLCKDKKDGYWYEIGDVKARRKCAQVMRERSTKWEKVDNDLISTPCSVGESPELTTTSESPDVTRLLERSSNENANLVFWNKCTGSKIEIMKPLSSGQDASHDCAGYQDYHKGMIDLIQDPPLIAPPPPKEEPRDYSSIDVQMTNAADYDMRLERREAFDSPLHSSMSSESLASSINSYPMSGSESVADLQNLESIFSSFDDIGGDVNREC